MIVTPDMVDSWGADCSGKEWFREQYPKGVEITAENARKCPSAYYHKLWLMKQVAMRCDARDASAQVAADMIVELAEPVDIGWCAGVVADCPGLDTEAALQRVLESHDRESLMRVTLSADTTSAERAAKELADEANPATLEHIEREWPEDRRALVDDARAVDDGGEVTRGV